MGPVRLHATMRRCLGALRRSQKHLSSGGAACSSSGRARHLVDALEFVAKDVERGSIISAGAFALRSRAVFAEALMSAKLAQELFADAFAWFALLEDIQKEFDAELLLVEVPEVELARLPSAEPSALKGSAFLFLDVELEVLCSKELRMRHINPLWAWADVTVVREDGTELGTTPRVHLDSMRVDPVAEQQPEDDGEEKNLRTLVDLKHEPSKGTRLKFSRRLRCTPANAPEGKLLRELVEGQELKVSLRVDWPILQNSQVTLLGCGLALATLRPES